MLWAALVTRFWTTRRSASASPRTAGTGARSVHRVIRPFFPVGSGAPQDDAGGLLADGLEELEVLGGVGGTRALGADEQQARQLGPPPEWDDDGALPERSRRRRLEPPLGAAVLEHPG